MKNTVDRPDFTPYECPITGMYVPCINGIAVLAADEFVHRKDALEVAKHAYHSI